MGGLNALMAEPHRDHREIADRRGYAVAGRTPMTATNRSTLRERVKEYLEHRRSLGFGLKTNEVVLRDFVRFAKDAGHRGPLSTEFILRWATHRGEHSSRYQAERLSIVRGFARYLAARDGKSEVPDQRLLGGRFRRGQPHIYSDEQLHQLLEAASTFPSADLPRQRDCDASPRRPNRFDAAEHRDCSPRRAAKTLQDSDTSSLRHSATSTRSSEDIMTTSQFATFVQRVRELGLERSQCMTSAHHSNGSGRDWEALQREVAADASLRGVVAARDER